MKKLIATVLFAASLCLTACEKTANSGEAKANLEGKGYIVEVLGSEETKARIKGINYNVEIKDSVYAKKGSSEIFLAFYCNNAGDASAFVQENISAMYHFAETYIEDPKTGSYNNVAYVGSTTTIADAGFKL